MMDLTKIEKPFGLLDKETQDALREHYENEGKIQSYLESGWIDMGGVVFYKSLTYRAKPEPDQVAHTLYVNRNGAILSAKITYNIIDGEIDCESVRMEKVEGE